MSGDAVGGNDRLISGNSNDNLWGDAQVLTDNAVGGADIFVFISGNGWDTIHDFEQGKYLIDFTALGLASFQDLSISVTNGNSTIHFGGEGTVVVTNVNALSPSAFLLL
jgi:hypothetical protein